MFTTTAYLHFADGTSFKGKINRPKDDPALTQGIWGEAAFTSAMSGYQETITDPSYLGQHIVFASPHIGNYASREDRSQSPSIHASSVIARSFHHSNSYWNEVKTPLFTLADTRALVRYLTQEGKNHVSVITTSSQAPDRETFKSAPLKCNELSLVSRRKTEILRSGDQPIVIVDYGIKKAIINEIRQWDFPTLIVPHHTKASEILSHNPRLVFLSNGPGDPRVYKNEIEEVKKLLATNVPMRGICLGHQLIGLALGAEIIKLPFGQRGINHPCFDHRSGQIIITSQNHGYSIEENSFHKIAKENYYIQYSSLFDQSIEGIASFDERLVSVQFHPEASPGPSDGNIFFKEIYKYLENNSKPVTKINKDSLLPLPVLGKKQKSYQSPYKKILLVGSGPIKIGQASEFDYSGTQACKSLKELGVEVVLLNSNPATIMTDPEMASRTYIEPITKDVIKKIIEKENVDAVLSTMGGQTALNLCIELEEENYLKNRGVALLGANVETIKKTEDRQLFAKELEILGYQSGNRTVVHSEAEAQELAQSRVGFPLIIRRDFALGGKGAALAHNPNDLCEILKTDIKFPITMEKSLLGWKEIELEVMVDEKKNAVIICSIENVDPCGIHTGDSITVAPAQTISDRCYQNLREMALKLAVHMGIVAGGANVQFAINPEDEDDIVIIEMNPRVSRSSALASKATGYPIAKISAMLAVGLTLPDILNDITQKGPVAFEPTLDYVAIKIPVFPFNKFPTSSRRLGPSMRSVGEVLALGATFNEALMKAFRSLEMGLEIPKLGQLNTTPVEINREYILERLSSPRELSILTCLEALRLGLSVSEIHQHSRITPWFIEQIDSIVKMEQKLAHKGIADSLLRDSELFLRCKRLGLSDKYLALLTGHSQAEILKHRDQHHFYPHYQAVDTCSGEFFAETPYFYSTWFKEYDQVLKTPKNIFEAIPLSKSDRSIVILGSGPNRIGQGIEFDYSCVKACMELKNQGIKSIMVNSNPETVSTDYDSSDRLYLAPLYSEDLFDILKHENPEGVISCFSGQTGIAIRGHLEKSFRQEIGQFNFLGPGLDALEMTEDRKLFYSITKKVPLEHTQFSNVTGHKDLVTAIAEIGLPVIIRPSYVIGGESMYIFKALDDIEKLPEEFKKQLKNSPLSMQVETYLEEAIEYDVDLVRDSFGHCMVCICEHIEHAGVHSGDSGMITPPVILTDSLNKKIKEISKALAKELNIIGPINFQFAVKNQKIYCIEANPRGSRTLPFLSKAYNISLPQIAVMAMLGHSLDKEASFFESTSRSNAFCVKQSTFPFDRFVQDNIILGPKMRSTGETMGIDKDKDWAVLKSYLGNYPLMNKRKKILFSLSDATKELILPYLKQLRRFNYELIATPGTAQYIKQQGLACEIVSKVGDSQDNPLIQALKDEELAIVFNTPLSYGRSKSDGELIRNTAILYGVPCFTRPENIKSVIESLCGTESIPGEKDRLEPFALQDLKISGDL